MIIRCPHCEHTRSISEGNIPSTAELATCPKCKHRFRFRTLPRAPEEGAQATPEARPSSEPRQSPAERQNAPPAPEVLRPQEAFRESAEQNDIWDAVDALHQRLEKQLEQHVVEVDHPGQALADPLEVTDTALSPSPVDGVPAAHPHEDGREAQPAARSVGQPPDPGAEGPLTPEEPGRVSSPYRGEAVTAEDEEKPDTVRNLESADAAPHAAKPRLRVRASADDAAPEEWDAAPPEGAAPAACAAGLEAVVVKPRFPYGEDGPDPEERVEKDMEMLRGNDGALPTRDLGRLREFPEVPEDAADESGALHLPPSGDGKPAAPGRQDGIPWEQPGMGKLAAFSATVRGVMLSGPDFFKAFSGEGSLAPGYLFFLIMGYVGIVFTLAWCRAAEALLPGLLPPFPKGIVLPALLLLAPAALGLMQLFVTGWIRLFLRLIAPEKADFGLIYKIVSYSVAPFVLSVVPFAGPVLGAAWFMGALAAGCKGALRLSLPLSLLVPLPPAALLLAGLVWFFF